MVRCNGMATECEAREKRLEDSKGHCECQGLYCQLPSHLAVVNPPSGGYTACRNRIAIAGYASRAVSVVPVHEYDDRTAGSGDLRLRRLSGIMLVNRGWMSCGPVPSNVEFCRTLHAAEPLTENLATALHCICLG